MIAKPSGEPSVAGSNTNSVVVPPQPTIVSSNADVVVMPSQAAVVPSQTSEAPLTPVDQGNPSTRDAFVAAPLPVTIPTPAQLLSMTTRPQLPPIHIPTHQVPNNVPSTKPTPQIAAPAPTVITSTPTQFAQPVPSSLFSPAPVPTPTSSSASTPTPALLTSNQKKTKKKIVISDDLALSDLEWLKLKRKKDSKAASKSTSGSTMSITPPTEEKKKVIPVSEDMALSDAMTLDMKRAKDIGATNRPAAGEESKARDVTSSTIGSRQSVDHPDEAAAAAGSISNAVINESESTIIAPVGPMAHIDSYAASSEPPVDSRPSGDVHDNNPQSVARSNLDRLSLDQAAGSMDVDQPHLEAVEQYVEGDASTNALAPAVHTELGTIEDGEMLGDDTIMANSDPTKYDRLEDGEITDGHSSPVSCTD